MTKINNKNKYTRDQNFASYMEIATIIRINNDLKLSKIRPAWN